MIAIENLSWLANKWIGSVGDEFVEESWSSPVASSMMGMFRWYSSNGIKFFEFLTIEGEGDNLFLRIVHFDPGLKSWEPRGHPTEFRLFQLHDKKVVWEPSNKIDEKWLSYQIIDDGSLMTQLGTGSTLKNPTIFQFQAS